MEDEELFSDLPNQTWDMGTGPSGTQGLIHIEDGQIITEKWYDAEPLADDCHENRAFNQGANWGEGQVVGSMPPHIFQKMLMDGTAFDQAAVMRFFRSNPQFVRFEKVLK